ncbi:glycosyl hydrolase 115 family protein [Bifidobacterium miconis]|uniref:glycosyl hydrolase 115 family protein n=1 Tax=Bifidobacterium miconis TaxID=2834435 RepID=UPI003B836F68
MDWAKAKYPTEHGTPDVNFYRHVFELTLRLKLNVLWPAMHEGTTAFNTATDDHGTPINAREAAEYGVIMSSSHCENMLRNNVGEWRDWFDAHHDDFDWRGGRFAARSRGESSAVCRWRDAACRLTNTDECGRGVGNMPLWIFPTPRPLLISECPYRDWHGRCIRRWPNRIRSSAGAGRCPDGSGGLPDWCGPCRRRCRG